MAGAQIRISEVHNDALREYVVIANLGTLPQPMSGWALATMRGERLFFFPDGAILPPGKTLSVHSGQDAQESTHTPLDLFWTDAQMWSNRRDVAVLFDANGLEVSRHAYPPARTNRRANTPHRRKRLLRQGETWGIEDEPTPEARTGWRRGRRTKRR